VVNICTAKVNTKKYAHCSHSVRTFFVCFLEYTVSGFCATLIEWYF